MSFRHMQLVIDHSQTTGPDRAIMLVLAYRADEKTAECWPGLDRIASDAGLTRRCIYKRLPVIEATGELTVIRNSHAVRTIRGTQFSNTYRIELSDAKGREQHSPPIMEAREHGAPREGTGCTKLGNRMHEAREQRSPKSSLNRQNKPTPNLKPGAGAGITIRTI
jgi:hypothetical protein